MKTDLTHMTKIYSAYLSEREIEPGSGCPAPDDIVRLVTTRASRKARARLLAHIASCGDCALVLQSILRLSREIDRLTIGPEALQSCAQNEATKKDPRRSELRRRVIVTALAGLIGLTVITYSVVKLIDRPAFRGTRMFQIKLISPKQGASLVADDINFKWAIVPKAMRYTVELFDKSLAKIWHTGSLTNTATELPAEARGVVLAGETYFWRVTAVLEDGEELLSRLSEFSLRR